MRTAGTKSFWNEGRIEGSDLDCKNTLCSQPGLVNVMVVAGTSRPQKYIFITQNFLLNHCKTAKPLLCHFPKERLFSSFKPHFLAWVAVSLCFNAAEDIKWGNLCPKVLNKKWIWERNSGGQAVFILLYRQEMESKGWVVLSLSREKCWCQLCVNVAESLSPETARERWGYWILQECNQSYFEIKRNLWIGSEESGFICSDLVSDWGWWFYLSQASLSFWYTHIHLAFQHP